MKLGISYNLFDGEELLEYSIKYIRNQVDYISVVFQKESYFGDQSSQHLTETLQDLLNRKYIDEIHEYHPTIDYDADHIKGHTQTVEKRNIGLALSKSNNCTHHMCMDTDEFYIPEQFAYMKNICENTEIFSAVCQHKQYYKDSIYMILPTEQAFIETIFKITEQSQFVYDMPHRLNIDPSRKTNSPNCYRFSRNEIEMHHMSFVRKYLYRKLMCCLSRKDIEHNIEKIVEHYKNWKYPMQGMWAGGNLVDIVKVDRIFDIYPSTENIS